MEPKRSQPPASGPLRTSALVLFYCLNLGAALAQASGVAEPSNIAATTPNSGWDCPQPVCKEGRCISDSSSGPTTDEQAKKFSVELDCMVDWLTKYSAKGARAGQIDAALYSKQRYRARYLQKVLRNWTDRVHARGETPAFEDVYKTSGELYLDGVVSFQKGEFHQARTDWERALKADPKNSDAQSGLERLDKMKRKRQ